MKLFIKNKFEKYEKYLSPFAVISGFFIDNLTLRRVDFLAENIAIISYLLITLLSIFVLNSSHAGFLKHRVFRKVDLVFSFILQFVFGALFSAFFVFYFRSANFISSWTFLVFLLFFLIGNEFFRERYKRLSFQLSIFFIALFSYSVILIPLLTRKINNYTFIFSGLFAIFIMFIIIFLLYKFFPKRLLLNRNAILISILSIFSIFNLFYFLNIIPPIPLSLRSSEIVHSLSRRGESYQVEYEKSSFLSLGKTSKVFSWVKGEPVYFFTSIFAPTDININIYHKWYFYNETSKEWILKSTLSFPLIGGRDGGYRGFSYKRSVVPGRWKIETTNQKGQIIGSKKIIIKEVEVKPILDYDVW